jgi:hypothetical protein
MIYLRLWLLLLGVFTAQAAGITQKTGGGAVRRSAIAAGMSRLSARGVDPKALQRLNELLDKKDLEL